MKLRKLAWLCEHEEIKAHRMPKPSDWKLNDPIVTCPGGVFLPDDTLIIEVETVDGHKFWPVWAVAAVAGNPSAHAEETLDALLAAQNALSVREAETEVDKNQMGMW